MRIGIVLVVLAAAFTSVLASKPLDTLELGKRCATFKFDQWTECVAADSPLLRSYLQERGILAPGSSHSKLVRHAQADCDNFVSEVRSAAGTAKDEALARASAAFDLAQRFKNEADATLAKAYADASSSASGVYAQASAVASDHVEHLHRTGQSVLDAVSRHVTPAVTSIWEYARDTFAEQQPLRFQNEKMASFKHAASSAASSAAAQASRDAGSAAQGFSSAVDTVYTQAHSAASAAASAIHAEL